jgi:hypothetical protein
MIKSGVGKRKKEHVEEESGKKKRGRTGSKNIMKDEERGRRRKLRLSHKNKLLNWKIIFLFRTENFTLNIRVTGIYSHLLWFNVRKPTLLQQRQRYYLLANVFGLIFILKKKLLCFTFVRKLEYRVRKPWNKYGKMKETSSRLMEESKQAYRLSRYTGGDSVAI